MTRSTAGAEIPATQHGLLATVRHFWQLVRPRIVGLVLFTQVVAAVVSGRSSFSWAVLAHAVVGSTLVIMGAIGLNARLEQASDAKMLRTARRPLPAGRLSGTQVTWFAATASALGIVYLLVLADFRVVVMAAASWAIYVWVYTPLKLFTAWQTPIGAVAGAMPVMLGSATFGNLLNPTAWALFGMVYFWQFPHAMAIAWLYRHQFAAANLHVATVVDPTGRIAAWLALLGAVVLLPISVVPTLVGAAGWGYGAVAVATGLAYLVPAVLFFCRRDDRTARTLLRSSFAYIPLVFIAILLAAL